MTTPSGWLDTNAIELDVPTTGKPAVLELLARRLAMGAATFSVVFEALKHREEMGCTGLGHGVALPHARLAGLKRPVGAFFRLKQAIEFGAPDGDPVDLVLGLLLPSEGSQQQLQVLAHVAGLMAERTFRESIRRAADAASVKSLFARGVSDLTR
jgi:PTS system nitrogen regulatory IIA component